MVKRETAEIMNRCPMLVLLEPLLLTFINNYLCPVFLLPRWKNINNSKKKRHTGAMFSLFFVKKGGKPDILAYCASRQFYDISHIYLVL